MPFLTINGLTIPVALRSARRPAPERIGANLTRKFSGKLSKSEHARKAVYEASTPVLTAADARAIRGLLEGDGHHWAFDSTLYSSKGLGPSAGTMTLGSAGQVEDAASLAAAASIVFPTALGAEWTVAFWHHNTVAWNHYAQRSDGTKWIDGAVTGGPIPPLTVDAAGNITLTNGAAAAWLFDELLALPYKVLDAWPAEIFARGDSNVAWPSLPDLVAAGDFIDLGGETELSVMGEVEETEYTRGNRGGGVAKNLQALTFRLREA